jgi:hypothetical protein
MPAAWKSLSIPASRERLSMPGSKLTGVGVLSTPVSCLTRLSLLPAPGREK